jgi:hypothetical protein
LLEKNKEKPDPWCLQDGVAPQADIEGLDENRAFFPPGFPEKNKGKNNAHFIRNYLWILDIKKDEGRITPRK